MISQRLSAKDRHHALRLEAAPIMSGYRNPHAATVVVYRWPSGSVAIGLGAPIELDGNSILEGVSRFPELFPFLSFGQPVFHFSLSDRSPLTAHAFLRGEIIY